MALVSMSLRFVELVRAPRINMLVVPGELNWEGVRLYSECDFELMSPHQEPKIRRVHLGVAVLRILAVGTTDLRSFDFIDASNAIAMDMAIRNLIQLGAVLMKNDVFELTKDGLKLVRLGIEPWLGKIILECFEHRLGKEGLVLAAVIANASSIFCRAPLDIDGFSSSVVTFLLFSSPLSMEHINCLLGLDLGG